MSDSEAANVPSRAQDFTENKWESLPADSEAQVDYPAEGPAQMDLPPMDLPGMPLWQAEVPDTLSVSMTVRFPDGTYYEYTESVDVTEDTDWDLNAQASAMVEVVGETLKARCDKSAGF